MPSPLGAQDRKDVREVALAALLADLVERLEQPGSLEDVAAEVDLADRELLGGTPSVYFVSTMRSNSPSAPRTMRP